MQIFIARSKITGPIYSQARAYAHINIRGLCVKMFTNKPLDN